MVSCNSNNSIEPIFNGQSTPDEVVEIFLEAVQENDYKAIMNLYPSAYIIDICNMHEFFLTVDTDVFSADSLIYNYLTLEQDIYKQINLDIARGEYALQILMLFSSFFPETDIENSTKEDNPVRLSEIEILSIDTPKNALTEIDLIKISGQLDKEEITDRIALVRYNNETFAIGFKLLKHDESWGILRLMDSFIHLKSGLLIPVTQEEYDELK
jgi:hypothetical protein